LSTKHRFSLMAILVIGLAIAATAENMDYTVNVASNDTLGNYLVNQTGFALYYFTNDVPGNNTSSCYGSCAANWPPFYAENIAVPEGLNVSDFTEITRTDGMEQTAYKGMPLYFFHNDMEAGDVKGQGVGGVWFVVNTTASPSM